MSKRQFNNILITGGSGFIGANFIHYLFKQEFQGNVINIDKLTYAGNPENLKDIEKKSKYFFYQADICDYDKCKDIILKHNIDCVVHFAAESHVDRSIHGPKDFIYTNIIGTFNLLEICRNLWKDKDNTLFHHISTDEVFGSLGDSGYFFENTPYDPRSPYSASKASSDHLVSAYFHTYELPVTISNCSNNYGAYQFPEKLIPLMILNLQEGENLPVYGDGKNIRDWLYVEDHCSGIYSIIQNGNVGETYNIGGENEWENIKLVNKMCSIMDELFPDNSPHNKLITYVKDRPGHDRRYAINCNKIKDELGWKQSVDFETGLRKTINWYLSNTNWINNIKSGTYKNWLQKNYESR
ncbi:MAG: dTDP-glucose 4,6-dehydratase [Candidatus Cloacimonetes bacterium]|nr:dTDP-glucose 4,6-dehydratase [Candidatus Cloacimonadota bacterium]MDD4155506.1 dTDP-glucose 4,6-dehydratase [Candidatus Cloacimonadota bacterium]